MAKGFPERCGHCLHYSLLTIRYSLFEVREELKWEWKASARA